MAVLLKWSQLQRSSEIAPYDRRGFPIFQAPFALEKFTRNGTSKHALHFLKTL
jgi:hypothetical protein